MAVLTGECGGQSGSCVLVWIWLQFLLAELWTGAGPTGLGYTPHPLVLWRTLVSLRQVRLGKVSASTESCVSYVWVCTRIGGADTSNRKNWNGFKTGQERPLFLSGHEVE